MTRPSRELLFTVVTRDEKYRAKNAIDTMVYRFGDMGASWLHTGLLAVGGGAALIGLTLPMVAGWVVLATVLGLGFRRKMASAEAAAAPPDRS